MMKKITTFDEETLDQLMNIWLRANIDAHDFIPATYWKEHLEYVRGILPEAEVYGYYEESDCIGFMGLTADYIAGIFIEQSRREQGIGSILLAEAKKQHERLSLNVYMKNEVAVNFYHSQEFDVVKENIDGMTEEMEYIMEWTRKG